VTVPNQNLVLATSYVVILCFVFIEWLSIQLHREFYIFSDNVMLKVTDRNGTKIASTNIIIYKCRTATKYVHVRQNVVVRSCCVKQYRRVAMQLVHVTGKTWYKVIYQHTKNITSLSNIYHYRFAFYLHSIAQILLHFSDTVMLKVTDINGTKIASTQVMLYKCRTATTYVHVRQNIAMLPDMWYAIS
jgi:hypothetical protein